MKQGKEGVIPAIASDDPEMQQMCNDSDEKVRTLARLRLLLGSATQLIPRMETLIQSAEENNGCLPPVLQYNKSITGRFAGEGFNIQSIPKARDSQDKEIQRAINSLRRSIHAPDGKVFVVVDACQIEARVLSWLCGQQNLSEAFARGDDIYSQFAEEIFEEEVRKTKGITPEEKRMHALRGIGKQAVLGLGYQMGVQRFIDELRKNPECVQLFEDGTLSKPICAQIVDGFRNGLENISAFWERSEQAFLEAFEKGQSECFGLSLSRRGTAVHIHLPSGRDIVYPRVRVSLPQLKKISFIDFEGNDVTREMDSREISYGDNRKLYGGKITENITQAVARDILVHSILSLDKEGWSIICHVHDDILCCVPEDKAEECLDAMIHAWRNVPDWAEGLVLDAEGKVGHNFLKIV